MQITTIGLDLAKTVFQVHGVDARGTVVVAKPLRRGQVLAFFTKLPPCLIGLEACAKAHHRNAYRRRGIDLALGEQLSLGYQFRIASSREQGMREAAIYYEENMKMFGELRLSRAITEEQIAAMRDPRLVPNTKLPRIEDAVKAGGFLTGTPVDIIEQLQAVETRYPGLERVSCSLALGTPLNLALEQLERFAKEVMPAFHRAKDTGYTKPNDRFSRRRTSPAAIGGSSAVRSPSPDRRVLTLDGPHLCIAKCNSRIDLTRVLANQQGGG